MLYCSFGNGLRLTGDKSYEEVLLTGARSLATRFKPEVGLIRSWDHNRDKWQHPVIIDNMMNLELLMWAADRSGDKSLRDMAASRADKAAETPFSAPTSAPCHLVVLRPRSRDSLPSQADPSGPLRLLGLEPRTGMGTLRLHLHVPPHRATPATSNRPAASPRFLHQPQEHARRPGFPTGIPTLQALASTPRDASAAAIMASALVELSGFVPAAEGERYMAFAEKQIRTLASPEYTRSGGCERRLHSPAQHGSLSLLLGGRRAAHLRRLLLSGGAHAHQTPIAAMTAVKKYAVLSSSAA